MPGGKLRGTCLGGSGSEHISVTGVGDVGSRKNQPLKGFHPAPRYPEHAVKVTIPGKGPEGTEPILVNEAHDIPTDIDIAGCSAERHGPHIGVVIWVQMPVAVQVVRVDDLRILLIGSPEIDNIPGGDTYASGTGT